MSGPMSSAGASAIVPEARLGAARETLDAWVREERHKVMYRDESKID